MKLRALILVLFSLLIASPVAAQNVTCATRPLGDRSNACASTAFVGSTVQTNIIEDFGGRAGGIFDNAAVLSALPPGYYLFSQGNYRIGSSITVNRGIFFDIRPGSSLAPDIATVTTLKGVVNPNVFSQIFTGLGKVVGLAYNRPEWWGVNGAYLNTDDSQPGFQSASDSALASFDATDPTHISNGNYGTVDISKGFYNFCKPWNIFVGAIPTAILGAGANNAGSWLQPCTGFSADSYGNYVVQIHGGTVSASLPDFKLNGFSVHNPSRTNPASGGILFNPEGANYWLHSFTPSHVVDVGVYDFPVDWRAVNTLKVVFDRVNWTSTLPGNNDNTIGFSVATAGSGTTANSGELYFKQFHATVCPPANAASCTNTFAFDMNAGAGGTIATIQLNGTINPANNYINASAHDGGTINDVFVDFGLQMDGVSCGYTNFHATGAGSTINDIRFSNVYHTALNVGCTGDLFQADSGATITNISLTNGYFNGMSGQPIVMNNVTTCTITGNQITGGATGIAAIELSGTTNHCVVGNNPQVNYVGGTPAFSSIVKLEAGTDYITINGSHGDVVELENLSTGTHNNINIGFASSYLSGYTKANSTTGKLTASNTIPLSDLAAQATNTIVGNATAGSAAPTALAIGSCDTATKAVQWTTNTGFGCNSAINAATLGGATFAAPGSIGSGTPGSGAFTTLSATGQITSTLAPGTAPFVVASTTQVANLYAARAALADSVTTNANLTGDVTSVGNTTTYNSIVSGAKGGTGVANTGKTITIGANLTTTGAGAPTLAFPASPFTYTYPGASQTLASLAGTEALTNKDLSGAGNTFPTFNQNTTGSAAKWTTARNLAGNSVDGSANVAFANKFIVQGTTDAGLSAAQFLGALGTGLVKNTTTTGILSIASAGTDYLTSVGLSFTGGLISVGSSPLTANGTLALTVAGTSGGVPYFSSTSAWASSALLASNAIMLGGGAGNPPATTTTGTGVVTALGVNVGSAGAFVTNGGALGTPSGGTLTNATGLPIGGITGLGTGVGTALAANVTGSGGIMLAGSPTTTGTLTGAAANFSGNLGFGGGTGFALAGVFPLATGTPTRVINMSDNVNTTLGLFQTTSFNLWTSNNAFGMSGGNDTTNIAFYADSANNATIKGTTAVPAGGSTIVRLVLGSTAGFGIYVGSDAPTVSAAKGSLYLRTNGTTTNDRAYINTDGSTTWAALTTAN